MPIVWSEPGTLSLLTAFPLPFVAHGQEEKGKWCLLSGVLSLEGEELSKRDMLVSVGQGSLHAAHELVSLGSGA